jgi:hypothetical protein
MVETGISKPRVIAYYLPQYHPIPENDQWWGKGFTEWTNVGKAKPLFKRHYQPHIPADLGYYDLRVTETRQAQADMAREYGIEGFCYWHYWFGNGKRLLEGPFTEVLTSGKPNFPFCLGWANHSWKDKSWSVEGTDKMLVEQTYPGTEDYTNHFNTILPAFLDNRYIRVNNKPIFLIWSANDLPDVSFFIKHWNTLAKQSGLEGIHFVTIVADVGDVPKYIAKGFSFVTLDLMNKIFKNKNFITDIWYRLLRKYLNIPKHIDYIKYVNGYINNFKVEDSVFPQIVSNWDHSPRSGKFATQVLTNSTPQKFETLLNKLFNLLKNKQSESNIIFIRSWNEWAEGNHLEPDLKYGKGHLESLKKQIDHFSTKL